MTEVMLRENLSNEQKKIDVRIRARFLDEWILDNAPITPEFAERGTRLDIDVQARYRVLVAAIADLRRYADTPSGQQLIDRLNRRIRGLVSEKRNAVFSKTATRMICLLPLCDSTKNATVTFAQRMINVCRDEFTLDLMIGIGEQDDSVHTSYIQATKALSGCSIKKNKQFCFYQDLGLEVFTDEIKPATRREFVRRIFKGYTKQEIESLSHILEVYYECEGSIGTAADRLFMHKNTLQYKLNKLYDQTGVNPKSMQDCALFLLAIHFLQDESAF
jgi:carbohydrate diacid regulator